jgi:hypothetical protein
MAQVERYREIVQDVLRERAHSWPDIETQTIFDTERDHYQLVNVGWEQGTRRVYGTVTHIDIKDGKLWIQWDGTDYPVAEELLERGIPKSDIVLAFHAPYKRPYTEFATG